MLEGQFSQKTSEHDSRGEGVVLPLTSDPFTVVGLFCRLRFVVKVKLVETVGEGQQHQAVDEEELEDIQQHPAQRDLKRTQVRVGGEERDETKRAEDVGDGEESLGDEGGVPHLPILTRTRTVVLMEREDTKHEQRHCGKKSIIYYFINLTLFGRVFLGELHGLRMNRFLLLLFYYS